MSFPDNLVPVTALPSASKLWVRPSFSIPRIGSWTPSAYSYPLHTQDSLPLHPCTASKLFSLEKHNSEPKPALATFTFPFAFANFKTNSCRFFELSQLS